MRLPTLLPLAAILAGSYAIGQNPPPPVPPLPAAAAPDADYPPVAKTLEGYEKVVSTADGAKSFYTLWTRGKDQAVLAELPQNYASQKHFLALTVSSGEDYAGLQAGELYFYWKQYGKRLALMLPNTEIRSGGDQESQNSVKRLFTDSVLLDVPILGMVERGGPIIDIDELCVNMAEKFSVTCWACPYATSAHAWLTAHCSNGSCTSANSVR
jgi:hypothetical protein